MAKRNVGLKVRQARKQKERRYQSKFLKESTRLIDLVDQHYHSAVRQLVDNLESFLMEGEYEKGYISLTRLYFNPNMFKKLTRQSVYDELAKFFYQVKSEKGFKCLQSHFFRYLANDVHCNLGVSEKSLKALIAKAKPKIS
jgi:hypothetical protein